jgi:hypothetical protein
MPVCYRVPLLPLMDSNMIFVIPAEQAVSQLTKPHILLFCHSGLDPKSSFFKVLQRWMPDQVRHDGQKLSGFLNCDTVWEAVVRQAGHKSRRTCLL